MTSLRDQVHANPACAEALAAKDCQALAAIMSADRTRPNNREVGNGTILETLGLVAGNALLDVLHTDTTFRHVKPLLDQGRLLIGSPLVADVLRQLAAANVITQAGADALIALGREPDPLTAQELAAALFNDDGTEK
ncbi:hypothetical protein GJ700_12680 [Duganella sp. FT92W]|uniref:Uncharacterized protein n=1 Tax=Pseudoduganella rivuli TaxID=2666085 RepID=A0A7X2IN73_9BURK|nr:hypothetical protein [Pseudoduganella rivuli]MRV72563.1 hypothetical protein [Pseudoduganella rivuli]